MRTAITTIKIAMLAGTAIMSASAAHAQNDQSVQTAEQQPVPEPSGQQTSSAASTSEQGQDIVVTAQKRAERLLDVPLAVTAISEETIQKRGASTIEDLQYSVPGMSITEFGPGQQRIQLRGVSVFGGLPTVGVYLDELPLSTEFNQSGQDVRFLDINRVEVLRGPQGTLYGQGSLGGTVRYITNDADLSNLEASANGELGFVDNGGTDWKTEGMINIPIVADRLGARFAGSYQHFGGWIDNPVLGEKDVNDGHALTVRAKVGARVTDRFDVKLLVQHQNVKLGAFNVSDDDQDIFDGVSTPARTKVTMLNAIATYDFGFATLLSSTGYLRRRDGQRTELAPFVAFFPGSETVFIEQDSGNDIFTEEVRLSSNGTGPFEWTAGGYYRNSETDVDAIGTVQPDVLPPGFVFYDQHGTNTSDSKSWAVFGEASYEFTPALKALVGLRYFEDKREQDTISTVFNNSSIDQQSAKFDSLSPRFNLSWQPNRDLNVYVNVAKGFRSGGFNLTSSGLGIVTVPPTFGPESLWSYEVGAKYQSPDRKLSAEGAVYYNKWTDVQALATAGFGISYTVNGGKVAGWGVEGALNYTPITPLTLSLTGGWNNMEYKTDTAEHLKGDPADYVPSFTGSASAEYRFDVANLPSFFRVDYQYSDSFQSFVRTFQTVPAKSDKQSILNARLGIDEENWNAALFVRNLLNRDSIIYPAFGSLAFPARSQPRVIGVSLGYNFR